MRRKCEPDLIRIRNIEVACGYSLIHRWLLNRMVSHFTLRTGKCTFNLFTVFLTTQNVNKYIEKIILSL